MQILKFNVSYPPSKLYRSRGEMSSPHFTPAEIAHNQNDYAATGDRTNMNLKTDYLKGEMDGEKSKSDSVLSKLIGSDHYDPPSDPDRAEAYKMGHREGRK